MVTLFISLHQWLLRNLCSAYLGYPKFDTPEILNKIICHEYIPVSQRIYNVCKHPAVISHTGVKDIYIIAQMS